MALLIAGTGNSWGLEGSLYQLEPRRHPLGFRQRRTGSALSRMQPPLVSVSRSPGIRGLHLRERAQVGIFAPVLRPDQNASHQLRRRSEKVRPAFPVDRAPPNELEVSLMNKRGGLECVVSALLAHTTSGEPVKLVIDQRDEPVQGLLITLCDFPQK